MNWIGRAAIPVLTLTLGVPFLGSGGSSAQPQAEHLPPLLEAAWRGDAETLESLIQRGDSVNKTSDGQTALMWAAKMGRAKAVDVLLRHGAEVNHVDDRGWTALRWAVRGGHESILRQLLGRGADAKAGEGPDRCSLFHLAAAQANPGIVLSLLELVQSPPDVEGAQVPDSCLNVAASMGHTSVFLAMLDGGFDAALPGVLNRTPLHVAAQAGNTALVRDLLHQGHDSRIQDALGATPMHLAAEEGMLNVMREIMACDVGCVNLRDAHGWTPLHYAVAQRQVIAVRLLCQVGVIRIETPSSLGTRPIHLAAMLGDRGVLEELLCAGADLTVADGAGLDARHYLERLYNPGNANNDVEKDFGSSAAAVGTLTSALQQRPEEHPVLVEYVEGLMQVRPVSGIGIAVWGDGVVLFAEDILVPGRGFRVRDIGPSGAQSLLTTFRESGLSVLNRYGDCGIHSRCRLFTVATEDSQSQLRWNDHVTAARVDPLAVSLSAHRSFVRRTMFLEHVLASLRSSGAVALEAISEGGRLRQFDANSQEALAKEVR